MTDEKKLYLGTFTTEVMFVSESINQDSLNRLFYQFLAKRGKQSNDQVFIQEVSNEQAIPVYWMTSSIPYPWEGAGDCGMSAAKFLQQKSKTQHPEYSDYLRLKEMFE